MNVVSVAVGAAVVALVAGHQLSVMEPARREALWTTARALAGRGPAPELGGPPLRVASAPPPVAPPPAAPNPVALASEFGAEVLVPDRLGQFQTAVEIGGRPLSMMVDTGASFVSLSYEDAERLGLRPMPAEFKYSVSTANGRASVAKVMLPSVRLGGIVLRDVVALVGARGAMGQSLLGMSFLSRLSSMRMDHGRMVLAQ